MRFFAILFFAVLLPFGVSGQIIPTLDSPTEIQIVPNFPAAGANVLVTAQNVLNGDAFTYSWTVNGEVVEQGIGRNSIVVTVGGVGEETTVSVTITDGAITVGGTSRTIVPAELDLVWEAETYTPSFYVGRPLATGASPVSVTAVPNLRENGVRISESELVYEWFVDNSRSPVRSGYGLNTVSITPPSFSAPFTVLVNAKTQSGAVAVQSSVEITPRAPEIVLYEKTPLLGTLFNRAITNSVTLFDEEITVGLFPLYITNPDRPAYSWEVDGSPVEPGETPRELTLRKTGPGSGRFTIKTSLETAGSLFERASKSFILTF